jgi:hypothetical protein
LRHQPPPSPSSCPHQHQPLLSNRSLHCPSPQNL